MTFDRTWVLPERGATWLQWGFGTRETILRNEPASVKQVHNAQVLNATHAGVAGVADALVTSTPGLLLGIKTADCLPILMADMNQRVVAAVHAGWRGTARKIAEAAIVHMHNDFKTKPGDLLIAFGPSIGKCCFEVGSEVAQEFTDFDPQLGSGADKVHLDLQAINSWQLQKAGVLSENILRNELCTFCGKETFWSFRRERESAGRMWSVVGVEA